MCETNIAGYYFGVLNNAFIVHKGYKYRNGFHKTKEMENNRNRDLYRQFKMELKTKYPDSQRSCWSLFPHEASDVFYLHGLIVLMCIVFVWTIHQTTIGYGRLIKVETLKQNISWLLFCFFVLVFVFCCCYKYTDTRYYQTVVTNMPEMVMIGMIY